MTYQFVLTSVNQNVMVVDSDVVASGTMIRSRIRLSLWDLSVLPRVPRIPIGIIGQFLEEKVKSFYWVNSDGTRVLG